jgi:molybdate transport system regulatory protein
MGMPRDLELEPRLRFPARVEIAFGPGKAELLRHIASTGSISRSAARMKMSYNRAWLLVRDMNRLFTESVVETARGGREGGGASLTPAGRDGLARYTRMESACRKATRSDWVALRRRLRS